MSFISAKINRDVQGYGPKSARIVIVGDCMGAEDARQSKPFAGPSGTILEQCLHAAGLTRSECYLTNVIKTRPYNSDISPYFKSTPRGFAFSNDGKEYITKLYAELDELKPNVIVALGSCAMAALTGDARVMKMRGYFMTGLRGEKVLPTIHPSASLRGQYIYRYIISNDLKKAKAESLSPDLIRPKRKLVYSFDSADEVLAWIVEMKKYDRISVDIEVLNYEIALIGIAVSPDIGVAIPVANSKWTLSEEASIWLALNDLLSGPAIKIMQNGIFDIHFLGSRCGIHVAGPFEDTMMSHSIMYPDFRKGLDFLGSFYCGTQSYWKDLVKWDDIKENS